METLGFTDCRPCGQGRGSCRHPPLKSRPATPRQKGREHLLAPLKFLDFRLAFPAQPARQGQNPRSPEER